MTGEDGNRVTGENGNRAQVQRSVSFTVIMAKRSSLITLPQNGQRGQPSGPRPEDFLSFVVTIDGIEDQDIANLQDLATRMELTAKAAITGIQVNSVKAAGIVLQAIRPVFRPALTLSVTFADNANPGVRFTEKSFPVSEVEGIGNALPG